MVQDEALLHASSDSYKEQIQNISEFRISKLASTPFADVLSLVGDGERMPYMYLLDIEALSRKAELTVPALVPSQVAGIVNFYFLFHVLRSTWHSSEDVTALLAMGGEQLQNMMEFLVCRPVN